MEEINEKEIFVAYEVGLIFKISQAFLEVVGGVFLYFISMNKITNFVLNAVHSELIEDPKDFWANYFVQSTHQISTSGKYFIIFYLLTHGIIKLIIITGLILKKKWAYPLSIVGLGGLILYQIYHILMNNSVPLLIITIMDIVILWLIYHEHKVKNI